MEATIERTTQTTNVDHAWKLREWLERFSADYFAGDDAATRLVRSVAYRATERALNPQGTARTEKALSPTKVLKSGKKARRTTMSKNQPTWSQQAQRCRRHVPMSTIYGDSLAIASELWAYLVEFVNLVEFHVEDMGEQFGPPQVTFSLSWLRHKRSRRPVKRSGPVQNVERVLLWTAASMAISEKKNNDQRNSELIPIESDESVSLIARTMVREISDTMPQDISREVFPAVKAKMPGKSEQRRVEIENRKRSEQCTKLERRLVSIVEQYTEGVPLSSSDRVLLFRLKDSIPETSSEKFVGHVENISMAYLISSVPKIVEEFGPWEQSFAFAYVRTPCRMYVVK